MWRSAVSSSIYKTINSIIKSKDTDAQRCLQHLKFVDSLFSWEPLSHPASMTRCWHRSWGVSWRPGSCPAYWTALAPPTLPPCCVSQSPSTGYTAMCEEVCRYSVVYDVDQGNKLCSYESFLCKGLRLWTIYYTLWDWQNFYFITILVPQYHTIDP